jgi:MATE family multidrug resistance protein
MTQVIILLAGLLPDASVALSTMGICLNINAWMYMLPLGLGQAVNTSISNALGAGEHKHLTAALTWRRRWC